MRRILSQLKVSRSGVGALEFGIVAPVFLMLLLGGLEISRAMWTYVTINYAVQRGTRFWMTDPTMASSIVIAYTQGQLGSLDASAISITSPSTGTLIATTTFTTTVSRLTSFGSITLSAKSAVPLN